VKEFRLEVSADVAVLGCVDKFSGPAHGVGGAFSSSVIGAGLLRPKPNLRAPSFELPGAPAGDFSLCSCFLVNKPILSFHEKTRVTRVALRHSSLDATMIVKVLAN
jgi:hypothetical protein